MSIDDNLIEAILRSVYQHANRRPQPEDYNRVIEITDDKALMLQTAMQMKKKEINEQQQLVDTLIAELEGMKGRLFMRLREVYPKVTESSGPEFGRVIKHKGVLYYVGLDLENLPGQE